MDFAYFAFGVVPASGGGAVSGPCRGRAPLNSCLAWPLGFLSDFCGESAVAFEGVQ